MKQKILIATALLALSAGTIHAQDRFNNRQFSLFIGSQNTPEMTFCRSNGTPINVKDQSNALPWNVGLRLEREKMVSEEFGLGWCGDLSIRHIGWHVTIPAGTPGTGYTGLAQTDDGSMKISMIGFNFSAGLYGSLHFTPEFEVFASAGLTALIYLETGSSATSGSFETDLFAYDMDAEDENGLKAPLIGPYGQLGVKYTFNEDFFVSLSCRYSHNILSDKDINGMFYWDYPFYGCRGTAPFTHDFSVMLGIGILIEG